MIKDFEKSKALIKSYRGFKKNPSVQTLNDLIEHMIGLRYSSYAVKNTLKCDFIKGYPSESQKQKVVDYWISHVKPKVLKIR
jgi:hypothetical protein